MSQVEDLLIWSILPQSKRLIVMNIVEQVIAEFATDYNFTPLRRVFNET